MPTQTKIRRLFTEFDTDGSGFVELDELHSALLKGGKKSTRQDTIALLAEVDLNHDAKISLDEFEAVFKKAPDALPPGLAQLVDVSNVLMDGLSSLGTGAGALVTRIGSIRELKLPDMLRTQSAINEETLDALFAAIDTDGSGALDANELLALVLQMGIAQLDAEAVNSLIREVDLNGDGEIQRDEFAALVNPHKTPSASPPHLVLNFDVNMTVLMLDSAIGGDSAKILNMVLSNCVWGRVAPGRFGGEPQWTLVSSTPSAVAPEAGLQTFAEYMMSITDVQGLTDIARIKEVKARRRKALQTFISKGAPGAALLPELAAMTKALTLPDAVVAAAGAERLGELGLDSGLCGLLPSFLHMLRELKRAGRSFSVCFRTFGKDLPKLAAEYNALCEGTHPLFPDRDVVLDGSDGKADMRIALPLGATADGCGTFVRDVDGQISLVLGTIEQPPREEATRDGLARFYSAHKGTRVIHGAAAAAAAIEQLVGAGCNHTLALRDYYSGWEATGCQAHGGKPILLHRSPDALQLFFDDHITAHDAHIVDARRAEAPTASPLPIGATLNVHLLKAEPVDSISSRDYFLDAIAAAEARWRKQAARRARRPNPLERSRRALVAKVLTGWRCARAVQVRRALLADALRARSSNLATLAASGASGGGVAYVPHAQTAEVRLASKYTGAHDDDDALSI